MKRIIVLSFVVLTFLTFTNSSCKKNKDNTDKGCGCNTATIVQSVTDINAKLGYVSDQYVTGWVLSFPAGNSFSNFCKICNLDLTKLKAITDTMNHANILNVKFSGKAKDLCDGESFGYNNGSVFYYYISVDDIVKQ